MRTLNSTYKHPLCSWEQHASSLGYPRSQPLSPHLVVVDGASQGSLNPDSSKDLPDKEVPDPLQSAMSIPEARMGPFQLQEPCKATESSHQDLQTQPFERSTWQGPNNHTTASPTPRYDLADCGAGVPEGCGTPSRRPATRA